MSESITVTMQVPTGIRDVMRESWTGHESARITDGDVQQYVCGLVAAALLTMRSKDLAAEFAWLNETTEPRA